MANRPKDTAACHIKKKEIFCALLVKNFTCESTFCAKSVPEAELPKTQLLLLSILLACNVSAFVLGFCFALSINTNNKQRNHQEFSHSKQRWRDERRTAGVSMRQIHPAVSSAYSAQRFKSGANVYKGKSIFFLIFNRISF